MNRRNTLDVLRKYYINEIPNSIILGIMLCLSLICLMRLITPIQNALTDLSIIVTICGFSVASFIANKVQLKKFYHDKANKKDKKEPFSISRNFYLEKLKNDKGFLFLLGESGSGKSRILDKLEEQISPNIHCVTIRNNYFESWQEINNGAYIIFDQFEKILDISNPWEKINSIKSLNNCDRTIILSLRKEYFGEIYKMFEFHGNILWIEYNTDEQVQIITQLYNLIGEEDIFVKSGYTNYNAEQKLDALYSDIKL